MIRIRIWLRRKLSFITEFLSKNSFVFWVPIICEYCDNTGVYLTSTVGRGGIKYLTPRVKVRISFPRAEGARGRNFSTFTHGVRCFIPPRLTVEVRHSWPVTLVSAGGKVFYTLPHQEVRYNYSKIYTLPHGRR